MTDLSTVILVPTLWRSTHIAPFLEALYRNVSAEIPIRPLFLAQDGDDPTLDELNRCGADHIVFPMVDGKAMTMVQKCNEAAQRATEPFLFGASDDIRILPGCLERCHETLQDPTVHIACVSDGIPDHSHGHELTGHCLVRMSYIRTESGVMDEPNVIMHPGYFHYYSDVEFMCVGRARGVYRSVWDARIDHPHPNNRTAARDRVHQMGIEYRRRDHVTFLRRAWMWQRDTEPVA